MELANQDTVRDANLYAAKRVDLVARLTACRSKEEAAAAITSAQELYSDLFDAFQAGVQCARDKDENLDPPGKAPPPGLPICRTCGQAVGPGGHYCSGLFLGSHGRRPGGGGGGGTVTIDGEPACASCGVPPRSVHRPGCTAI